MEPSEPTHTARLNKSLEEVIALGYLTFQTGNFNKAEGLVAAARLISSAMGEDCPPELLERLTTLEQKIQDTQTCCDWVI